MGKRKKKQKQKQKNKLVRGGLLEAVCCVLSNELDAALPRLRMGRTGLLSMWVTASSSSSSIWALYSCCACSIVDGCIYVFMLFSEE
jgi:hypothetical protein